MSNVIPLFSVHRRNSGDAGTDPTTVTARPANAVVVDLQSGPSSSPTAPTAPLWLDTLNRQIAGLAETQRRSYTPDGAA